MSNGETERMQKHINIIGWLHIIYSALGLLLALGMLLLFGGLAMFVDSNEIGSDMERGIVALIGGFVATLIAVFSIPGLIAGYALIKRLSWGRTFGIVIGVLRLLDIPFGTALGVYTMWCLFKDETAAIFRPRA